MPSNEVTPEIPLIRPTTPTSGGAVYTIYGKSTCPETEGTELVYTGLVAKASFKESGGGVDYQCLTNDPQYLEYQDGIQAPRDYITGVEYEDWEEGPLSGVHHQGVPCAVCYTSSRSAVLTIPGRYECPSSWTREYYGYLVAERYSHANPSTYKCIDESREAIPDTAGNTEGGTMMLVETYCGSHICPTYDYSRELTCAVCSK